MTFRLEKDKAMVQRIVNGEMLEEPVLDVDVNAEDERGLLGVGVSKMLPPTKFTPSCITLNQKTQRTKGS
jgi:hypothetical protein